MTTGYYGTDPDGVAVDVFAFTVELQKALLRWELIGQHSPRFVAGLRQLGVAFARVFRPLVGAMSCAAAGEAGETWARFWAGQLNSDEPQKFVEQFQTCLRAQLAGIAEDNPATASELLDLRSRCAEVFRELVGTDELSRGHVFNGKPGTPQDARDLHAYRLAQLALDEVTLLEKSMARLGRPGTDEACQLLLANAREGFELVLDTYSHEQLNHTLEAEEALESNYRSAIHDLVHHLHRQLSDYWYQVKPSRQAAERQAVRELHQRLLAEAGVDQVPDDPDETGDDQGMIA